MSTKETNPKDVVGVLKWSLSYLPGRVLAEASVGMHEGGFKYGAHNYRAAGVQAMVYYNATQRHLIAWVEGQDIDPDSNVNHITKAICSLIVLRDSMLQGNWVDDRPIAIDPSVFAECNEAVVALAERYPNPVAPYTQAEKGKKDV